MKSRCDFKHIAIPTALVLAFFYVIFYFWGYTTADSAAKELHVTILKLKILGFTGLNGMSFFLGLMQSFIWGLILGGIFYIVHRFCPCEGCGSCGECGSCGTCGGGTCASECSCDCGSCDSGECCGACELGEKNEHHQ